MSNKVGRNKRCLLTSRKIPNQPIAKPESKTYCQFTIIKSEIPKIPAIKEGSIF